MAARLKTLDRETRILLRSRGGLSPREIREGLCVSKQGAMDALNPLLEAGLIDRVGTLKNGRYILK
jgi:predicted transcriptional regulator